LGGPSAGGVGGHTEQVLGYDVHQLGDLHAMVRFSRSLSLCSFARSVRRAAATRSVR
jgi:hypothetical protein